jgi:hypothetical protein
MESTRPEQKIMRTLPWLIGVLAILLCPWPAIAAAPAASGGSTLIGKLEGPAVVTDPAQTPKSFQEAHPWPSASARTP